MLWGDALTTDLATRTGQTLASFHLAADRFETSHSRYKLDEGPLLDWPLRQLEPYFPSADPADATFIQEQTEQVRSRLHSFDPGPGGWGIIHGDMHGRNHHVTADGQITIFDLDHSGYGWRAYDLAVLWAAMPESLREPLLAGYDAVRPLTEAERAMLPTFLRARMIWDTGDMLAMKALWGDVGLRPKRLARQLRETLKNFGA